MDKLEALRLIRLLSSLESWSFAARPSFPDYLQDDISDAVERLSKIVLGEEEMK